jgi:hypothetical protein
MSRHKYVRTNVLGESQKMSRNKYVRRIVLEVSDSYIVN